MRSFVFLFVLVAAPIRAQDLLEDLFRSYKESVYSTLFRDIAKDSTSIWLEDLHTDSLFIETDTYVSQEFWQEDRLGQKVGYWICYVPKQQLTVAEGINNPHFPTLITEYHYRSDRKVICIQHDSGKTYRKVLRRPKHPNTYYIPSVIDLME